MAEAFFIRVAVLHDEGRHTFRVPDRQSEPDRGTVVHHVQRTAVDPDPAGQLVDQRRVVLEGVGERRPVGHLAVPVARVVGRDDAELVRQQRDQVAEHLRRCREAMQQQQHGSIPGACVAMEDLHAIDLDSLVANVDGSCGVARQCVHRSPRSVGGGSSPARALRVPGCRCRAASAVNAATCASTDRGPAGTMGCADAGHGGYRTGRPRS